jgi:hypothetical protein
MESGCRELPSDDSLQVFWSFVATQCDDFERKALPADMRKFGGELYVASGTPEVTAEPLARAESRLVI